MVRIFLWVKPIGSEDWEICIPEEVAHGAEVGPMAFPPISCRNPTCKKSWIPRRQGGARKCPYCQKKMPS